MISITILLQNRTIECPKCGRQDQGPNESLADMKEIVEDQGWRVGRIVSDCEVRGLCPDCTEAVE